MDERDYLPEIANSRVTSATNTRRVEIAIAGLMTAGLFMKGPNEPRPCQMVKPNGTVEEPKIHNAQMGVPVRSISAQSPTRSKEPIEM